MTNPNAWIILGIVTIVLLIVFWRKRNAVWGSLTIGIIVGFIITIVSVFKGSSFDWYVIGKGAILGAIIGFIAELLGMVGDYIKRRNE